MLLTGDYRGETPKLDDDPSLIQKQKAAKIAKKTDEWMRRYARRREGCVYFEEFAVLLMQLAKQ